MSNLYQNVLNIMLNNYNSSQSLESVQCKETFKLQYIMFNRYISQP